MGAARGDALAFDVDHEYTAQLLDCPFGLNARAQQILWQRLVSDDVEGRCVLPQDGKVLIFASVGVLGNAVNADFLPDLFHCNFRPVNAGKTLES